MIKHACALQKLPYNRVAKCALQKFPYHRVAQKDTILTQPWRSGFASEELRTLPKKNSQAFPVFVV